ncbi:MAG: hypothetical protein OXH52_07035 [Gammaproteobacteria bacterium]|nr:hypothetical protein [Gammaproteobacteria bacterium]
MKRISMEADYAVPAGNVKLTIKVGEAQIGASVVQLAGNELDRGTIAGLSLGHGGQLKGSSLTIKSVVTDVNDRTNLTTITYELGSDTSQQEFTQTATVDQEGDSVIYRAEIAMV